MTTLRRLLSVLIVFCALHAVHAVAQETTVQATVNGSAKPRVYIDTDMAAEVDDSYAVFRALVAPELDIVGLSSMGWTGEKSSFADGTRQSQKMNEEILALMKLTSTVSHPLGALNPMPDAATPVDSPAVQDIIAKAKETPAGQKLHLFVLGAYTTAASALLIDPGIKDKLAVYVMGYRYNNGELTTNESNCQGDLNAAAYLPRSGVELHVMAYSTLLKFRWAKADASAHFKGTGGIRDYLVRRWETYAPDETERVLWDIAVFEAFLRPNLATEKKISHQSFPVRVWTEADIPGMQADYWDATKVQSFSRPRED